MDKSNEAFRERLEGTHVFPTLYLFKFIVTKDKLIEIEKLFPRNEIITKPSKKGNYISASIKMMMPSSDHIIEVYKSASKIEGIISL
jgi:putative lipoic acid-binding regulatory protein